LFRRSLLAAGIVVTAGLVQISAYLVRAEDSAEANSRGTPTPQQVKFFESQIRPLLAERCFKCHGPEKQKSELRLDSLVGMLKGGKSGAAIVPGKPAESNLVDAINYRTLEMPPDGKLADEQIELLTKWVEMGAFWPEGGAAPPASVRKAGEITAADRAYWAYQPVRRPSVPAIAETETGRNLIDCFVFARLKLEGLQPAPEAERAALVRRLYFDICGLPPTPEETESFVNDPSPQAYEQLVDRLLSNPRYGEHWARHWIDLARYAESDGYKQDAVRENAWRYRDYVIRAFNDDKPYDQFIEEQLAGDEWAPDDANAQIATGFLRQTIYEYNQRDVPRQWADILNELTDVTSDVFLGMGMGCARCHNHKFDPILQRDYFRLQAFFAPLVWRDDIPVLSAEKRAEYERQQANWEHLTADIRRRLDELQPTILGKDASKFPEDMQALLRKPSNQRTSYEEQLCQLATRQKDTLARAEPAAGDKKTCAELLKELGEFNDRKPAAAPVAMGVSDIGPIAPPTSIPGTRNAENLQPGFPEVLGVPTPPIQPSSTAPHSTGRRAVLARWVASADNPLTARVMVNRIWQYHFGRGLVGTSSDFGRLGEQRTHPELLDWLASEFVEHGWSIKHLQRLILTSATYRQSALQPASKTALAKDPQNYLLWKQNSRRLDADQVRDAALLASGELETDMFGPSAAATKPRRTIYTTVLRNTHDPLLEVFDAPDGYLSTPQRNTTTTPTQALLLINGDWMLSRAKSLAARLDSQEYPTDDARVDYAYRLVYGRHPTGEEIEKAGAFLKKQRERIGADASAGETNLVQTMPQREGSAAVIDPETKQPALHVADNASFPTGDFTLEAYVTLQTAFDNSAVRTITGQWDGNKGHAGWSLGVTGEKSKYKPRNVIVQLSAEGTGEHAYEVVASGIHLELIKPYYIAASVQASDADHRRVVFYVKDLSDNDAPLIVQQVAHQFSGSYRGQWPFSIGGLAGAKKNSWDGLIDDVRLTAATLEQKQLLWEDGEMSKHCVGYWKFENTPGFDRDSSGKGNHLVGRRIVEPSYGDPVHRAVLADFCHVLFNTNGFLYVD